MHVFIWMCMRVCMYGEEKKNMQKILKKSANSINAAV